MAIFSQFNPADWYWIVGGNETQVYSSALNATVQTSDSTYQAWLAKGALPSSIASIDELVDVLRAANVPPYHRVSVYRIIRRLEEGAFQAAALAVLDAPENAVLKARFYSLAGPVESGTGVPANDPDAIALVQAAGADPAVILAPE